MMDNQKTEQGQNRVIATFAALNKVVTTNIVKPVETVTSREYVSWGKNNNYPDYLCGLRKNAATLMSVISGCVSYVLGDKITCNGPYKADDGKFYMNRQRQTPRDVLKNLARDVFTYGGFCFEVVRSNDGTPVEIYWVDFRFIRSNKENTVFWYSEDWTRRWGKKNDIQYPKYEPSAKEVVNSLVYWKNSDTQVYPECPFAAAVLAAELEKAIDEYHWNSMNNGFAGSFVVNMNNGQPSDEVRDEIEKDFNEKFSGHQNAGRIMFCWNVDRDHMTTLQEVKASDFGEKYNALAKRARQQIFTAYRANPNLFGIPTENLGFSSEEYEGAFKLFNRTVIQPVQRAIIEAFQAVYDANMKIKPFSLEGDTENTETAE